MPRYSLAQVRDMEGEDRYAAYSALDATGTREIFDLLRPRLTPDQERIYRWSIAMIGPAATMTRRGILVDQGAREKLIGHLGIENRAAIRAVRNHALTDQWDGTELETGVCFKSKRKDGRHSWPRGEPDETRKCECCGTPRQIRAPFRPSSPQQVGRLLYDILHVPVHGNKDSDRSTDKEALMSIKYDGVSYQPTKTGKMYKRQLEGLGTLCDALLLCKDYQKQLGFLRSPLRNGRFHSSFNVFYPWTGRFSSSEDPFDYGDNAQNITEKHRHIFIPDPGYKLFYADLKTAESLLVAYLSGDEGYIEAHKGDTHTYVCRLLWPELPWTGDVREDKKIASALRPPWDDVEGHDYRFQSKRIQHGTNFGRTAYGVARGAHIPVDAARDAQMAYFREFPMIREYQNVTRGQVENSEVIVNPFGRSVLLFGRPKDEHTYKQALAFRPQSAVGDVLNQGLWRVWRQLDHPGPVQILAQVHDAVLGQFPVELDETQVVREIAELMRIPFPVTDIRGKTRTCEIQVEIATGWNWGKQSDSNPQGMKEIKL